MTQDLMELSDPALVSAVRAGDSNAFKALYRRHRGSVRRALASALDDPEQLDDAVQETFIRALERIGEVSDGEDVAGFLKAVARDTAADGAPAEDSIDAALDELAEVRELVKLVSGVLAELAPRDAQALAMAGYLDASRDDIVRELEISPPAADAALHRARRRLRTGVKLEVLVRSNAGGCLEFTVLTRDEDYPSAARHLATCELCRRAGQAATDVTIDTQVPTLSLHVSGPAGQRTVVLRDTLFVGRECADIAAEHRLIVTDPSVSRVHLELQVTPGTAQISATDRSRNGTLLNGSEMQLGTPTYLLDGDMLTMGDTRLEFRVDALDPDDVAASVEPADDVHRSRPATVTMIGFPLAITATGTSEQEVPTELRTRLISAAGLFGGIADLVPDAVLLVRWAATGNIVEAERQCAHFVDFAKLLGENAGVAMEWTTGGG